MRTGTFLLLIAAWMVSAPSSRADVINGTIQGTIAGSYSYDDGGLFGPPSNLSGKAITVRYSYNTNDFYFYGTNVNFGIGPTCQSCSYYMSTAPTAADYTSITVNGVTVTSTATITATLTFATATPTRPAGFDENIGNDFRLFMQQNPGISVGADTSGNPVFGKPIPDSSILPDLQSVGINVYSADEGFYYEGFYFTPNAVAVTPEPSTFALAGTGILSASCALRRLRLEPTGASTSAT